MDVQDRRVKRTQKALARALIDLTLEKGYETITIREITERAEVGYATFFRHYHDKDTLLRDVLDVVLDELTSLLQTPTNHTNHATTGTLVFRYVQAHSEVVHVLLSSQGSSALIHRIVDAGTQSVRRQNALLTGAVPADVAANHLVTSTMALILWWLEHAMPYPPEQMGLIYQELIARPTHAAAFEGESEHRQ